MQLVIVNSKMGYMSCLSKCLTGTVTEGFRYLLNSSYLPTKRQIKYTTTILMASYAIYLLYDMLPKNITSDLDKKEKEEKKKKYCKKIENKLVDGEFCEVEGTIFKYTGKCNLKLTNLTDKTFAENVLNTSDLENLIYCINKASPIPDKHLKIDEETGHHILLTLSSLTEEEKKRKLIWKHCLNDVQYELYFHVQNLTS
ncbi:hypothetical protein SNEBB_005902 [Seison nebaliae]|nr:hypothetical protein SNEBB_005902 [Seison nebaliae]